MVKNKIKHNWKSAHLIFMSHILSLEIKATFKSKVQVCKVKYKVYAAMNGLRDIQETNRAQSWRRSPEKLEMRSGSVRKTREERLSIKGHQHCQRQWTEQCGGQGKCLRLFQIMYAFLGIAASPDFTTQSCPAHLLCAELWRLSVAAHLLPMDFPRSDT